MRKRAAHETQDAPVLPERVAREDADRAAARLVGQPVQDDATEATRLPFIREEQPDLGGLAIGAAIEARESDDGVIHRGDERVGDLPIGRPSVAKRSAQASLAGTPAQK